ncbi:(d)CMP kinase [[Mycoplasma] mobile]|uniref:Cytidylate kinase n=1 Tax=Mycoplasma mobile (strain ATCC 43663 / 163K / NCTC 11711) TaxID=267748 RepID=Q6KHG0_MYCM1|nr:(d)CMP kinase [[Mycoplasma] mobile]AAT27970.1 cytidylate kinase [Mycoplasma mobile 163K]
MANTKKGIVKKIPTYFENKNENNQEFTNIINLVLNQYDNSNNLKLLGILTKSPKISESLSTYLKSNSFFSPLKEEKIKTVNLYDSKKIDFHIQEIKKNIETNYEDKTESFIKKLSSNKYIDDFISKWEEQENSKNINKNDIVKVSVQKIELVEDANLSSKSPTKINIAIDGPSGVGKSSISKLLSKKLNYTFIGTGKMYRAYALNVMENGINFENNPNVEDQVANLWSDDMIEYFSEDEILLNKKNVASFLNDNEIAKIASKIAKLQKIRSLLVEYQQKLAAKKGIIMEGRDITFKVLPNAELKIFLTASKEVRAKRRFDELKNTNSTITYTKILSEMEDRDYVDSTREIDPLQKTEDSIEIDTSSMTIEEVVQKIYDLAKVKEEELKNE